MNYQNVLITGASSGIGRAMAVWWVNRGATVYAAARRMNNLEELKKELGEKLIPVELDISKPEATVEKVQQLDDGCGGLDLVIANAGVGHPTPARTASWASVDAMLKVNVMGTAATMTAVLPRMVKRNRGHVAAVSSLARYKGLGAYSGYSGSKAFVSLFMESVRVDLHGTHVRATTIEPGFVKSEMQAKLDGKAPMPFVVPTPKAADIIGRALVRGARTIAFPLVHVLPSLALGWVPAPIYEPLAQNASKPQLALADEAARNG